MRLSESRPGRHPRSRRECHPAPDRVSHVAPENRPPVPLPLPRWTAMGARVGASPRRGSLPPVRAESASTTALSRPARDSLTLRPGRLLDPPRGSVVPRASTGRIAPSRLPGSYQGVPTLPWVELSSTGFSAPSWRTLTTRRGYESAPLAVGAPPPSRGIGTRARRQAPPPGPEESETVPPSARTRSR